MRRLGFLALALAITGVSAGFASACDTDSRGYVRQSSQDYRGGRGWNGDRRFTQDGSMSRSQRARIDRALSRMVWRQNREGDRRSGNRSWDGRGSDRWNDRVSDGRRSGRCGDHRGDGRRSNDGRWNDRRDDGRRSNDGRWDDRRSDGRSSNDEYEY